VPYKYKVSNMLVSNFAHARKNLKRSWSYFIRKVYETDPLVCPKCSGEMDIISFIDQAEVIIHTKRNSLAL